MGFHSWLYYLTRYICYNYTLLWIVTNAIMFANLIIPTCIKCNANLHIKCRHSVGIINKSWSNGNKPPDYTVSLLNSGEFM